MCLPDDNNEGSDITLNTFTGSNNQKIEVTITDITGKVIYTTIATDTQKVEVNTNDFAEGIYVVQIQAADFIGTKKLIVKK
jgi:5-hydroxyisourate hydrolase-like protein (transthyretin family)